MAHIGFIVALPAEARSLARNLSITVEAPMRVDDGLVWVSGIGEAAATAAAHRAIEHGVSGLVSWGTAAALVGSMTPGTVVLASHVGDAGQTEFEVTTDWRRDLEARLENQLSVRTGKLTQVTRVLRTPQDKRATHTETGAIAADMESAAIARAAKQADLPFLVTRVIADTLDMRIPDTLIDVLDPYGRPHLGRLFMNLLRHPGQLRLLMQLRNGFHRAQRILTQVRQLGGVGLACPE